MPRSGAAGQVSRARLLGQPRTGALRRPVDFPVKPEPLRVQAGLHRFGTDFGNGDADRQFFQRDATSPAYLAEKARVMATYPERFLCDAKGERDELGLEAARAWFARTLSAEGHGGGSRPTLSALTR